MRKLCIVEYRQRISNLSLTLITDRSLCKKLFFTVRQALVGGVRTVQLREKDLTTHQLYSLASEMRRLTYDCEASLIINDRVDIALAVDADGVHLGWQSMPIEKVRQLVGGKKLVGVSTHTLHEARQAQYYEADYITFGPVFPTRSKEGILTSTGVEEIQRVKKEVQIPVIALGGIDGKNVESVLASGADGIAVISSILCSMNPENASRQFRGKIDSGGTFLNE
ncbi:MAG: thiamine phosphate synthase [Candidatus Brocadiaceae bacterium]|nr:thiamine phosphate synthase [Candidatus Brocadiaceae bacterium]